MNVISVDSAARASSWEGAEEGDTLPMLGLVSGGDFREEAAIGCGGCFDVAESGEVFALISGTVWRRRRELVGATGGSRAILEAVKEGLGPQIDIGEKKGEVGLL